VDSGIRGDIDASSPSHIGQVQEQVRMNMEPAPPGAAAARLEVRRESLARRLDDGYLRIDEGILAGHAVDEWEAFWIRLLHEYEEVCRDLDLAA
jgi:hypothetical protein